MPVATSRTASTHPITETTVTPCTTATPQTATATVQVHVPDRDDSLQHPSENPEPTVAPGLRPATNHAPPPGSRPPRTTPLPDPRPATEIDPAPGFPPQLVEQARIILVTLRIRDPRLILTAADLTQLAPAAARWLSRGIQAETIGDVLTLDLPERFRTRPARLLAYRLAETPPALPEPTPTPVLLPWQTCDGCERAFRAAEPDHCLKCRQEATPTTTPPHR